MAKRSTTAKRPKKSIELPHDMIEATRRLAVEVIKANPPEEPEVLGLRRYTAREELTAHKNRQTRAARNALETIERIEHRGANGDMSAQLRDVFTLGALGMAMQCMGDEAYNAYRGKRELAKPEKAREARSKNAAKRDAEFKRRVEAKMKFTSITDAANQIVEEAKKANKRGFSLSVFEKRVRKSISK